MSSRKVKRPPEVPKEKITADELDLIRTAMDRVETGLGSLRMLVACFDSDGRPRAGVKDLAAGVRIGRTALRAASDALFSVNYPGSAAHTRVGPLLDDLWDTADIVILAGTVLERGKLPDGDGMTECPIQGALSVAVTRLEKLHEAIEANHAEMVTEYGSAEPATARFWKAKAAALKAKRAA
jgi:hypothetical protein